MAVVFQPSSSDRRPARPGETDQLGFRTQPREAAREGVPDPISRHPYSGNAVVNLISSIDSNAVTLKIFTSEISAW